MSMKKIFTSIAILLFTLGAWGQNNMGTPYSKFGVGLLPDNYGAYTGMGGVSAAMRDNYNINFLNPASYTALDSMRFYFQMGVTGEYVDVSTYKDHSNYKGEEDAKAALLWVAFLHELRKQQVRRDGDTVLRHRKPAEIPRPSGIALDIPGKG